MNPGRLKLRQKLLLLLVAVGLAGISALALVIAVADRQLVNKFLPENRALHDVESRSALLLQNYFRFMLTPDLINADGFDGSLVLIRSKLGEYSQLVAGHEAKEKLVISIGDAIDRLEQSGRKLIVARQRYTRINELEALLKTQIVQVFRRYESEVSIDIGRTIENRSWDQLSREFLPELRMIKSIHQQYLQLFLEIREAQSDPRAENASQIEAFRLQISRSNAMLELYQENSEDRARISGDILAIHESMLDVVDQFNVAQKEAGFALSNAEQSGIDLTHAIGAAITESETADWEQLRESLLLSGAVLLLTLVISYLLIYAGLDRLLRPLEKLQLVITRLGKGDFKQRSVDVIRTDEIGQLAAAFNRMAEQLEEYDQQKQEFIHQLEQKNMELERFTYTVSHELKSPLVTLSGFLGLLDRDLAAADQESIGKDMEKMSRAIDTMSHQLEDLLELSRVGQAISPPSRFSMTTLCHEVVQMMQGIIEENQAEVVIEESMPEVFADQARIREVIRNLVENGIKFASTRQGPRIEIDAEMLADKFMCRVRDNGPGIEPRYHSKVFGLFDRLDNAVPGTGVGLALVKRIIEIHDGSIWIESEGDGQGCCFCFTLPVTGGN